jgi:hypothetical protein
VKRFQKAASFSNVVAVAALFFAIGGGTVFAAGQMIQGTQIAPKSIPGNRLKPNAITGTQVKGNSIPGGKLKSGSIESKQIKAGAVGANQIAAGAITGEQIKAGSLTGKQIQGNTITGVTAAALASITYVTTNVAVIKGQVTGTGGTATCPPGSRVIGGGATVSNAAEAFVNEGAPTADRGAWFANGYSNAANITMTITAICAPVVATTG